MGEEVVANILKLYKRATKVTLFIKERYFLML